MNFKATGQQMTVTHRQLLKLQDAPLEVPSKSPKPITMTQQNIKIGHVEYVTPPNLLSPGDTVYWHHHHGLLSEVTVIAVNNSLFNSNQLYQVRLKDGSSIQVSHRELFLNKTMMPEDTTYSLGPGPALDGIQRLTLQAHAGTTAEELVRWEGMNLKKFRLSALQKSLSRIVFLTDSPLEAIRVHDAIQLAAQMAHSENCSFFPDIETLTPQFRFRDLLPPETYQSYHASLSYYNAISKTIRVWLMYPAVTASAPLIKRALDLQVSACENDGLTLLMTAYRVTMPHLGSGNVDFNTLIAELHLMDGDDIFVFLSKAQKIDTLCKRCRLIIPANGLIKKVIYQLHRSIVPQHQAIISPIMIDYTKHVRKLTESVIYYAQTVSTITTSLQDAQVPSHARIDELTEQGPTTSSIFDDPPVPALSDLYTRDDDDDGYDRLARISAPMTASQQAKDLSAGVVHQLHALRTVIDRTKKQRGYLKSATGDPKAPSSAKIVCRFCAGPHDTEACFKRGEAFWPEEQIRKKERFNLLNGDKPKASTEQKAIPLKATFIDTPKSALKTELSKSDTSTKPEVRFMSEPSLEDQLAEMVEELNNDVANGVDIEDLSNHVIQSPAVFNIRTEGETDFHPLDSSTDSGYDIDEAQVNF